jgi:TPR repeat protein
VNKKVRALLLVFACLGAQTMAHQCAAEENLQSVLNRNSADKIETQQDVSNAVPPDFSPTSFTDDLKRAEQGNTQVQYLLGRRYYFGDGVPQDRGKAFEWQSRAADQGHATAQYILGLLYSAGDGVPQDKKKTVEWISRSAEQGLAEAQYALGMMYWTGEDVPQDSQKGAALISRAAAQGNEGARKKVIEWGL